MSTIFTKYARKNFWLLAVGALGGAMTLAPLFMQSGTLRAEEETEEAPAAETVQAPAECTFFTNRPLHSARPGDEQSFGDEAAVWSASMASNQTALVAGQLPNLRGGRTVG